MVIKINLSEEQTQKYIGFTLAYMVSFLALLNCVNAFLNNIGLQTALDTIFCYAILVGSILFTGGLIFKTYEVKTDIVVLPVGMLIAYFMTYLVFIENRKYMFTSLFDIAGNGAYVLFLYSVPGYIFIRYLRDNKYLDKYLRIFSYIVVYLSVYVFFFAKDSFANQYMTLSYNMLLQTVFLIEHKSQKFKFVHCASVAIAIFIIVAGGARGALLGLMVYFFLIIFVKKTITWKTILVASTTILGFAFVIFYYEALIKSIISLLEFLNIESRTFELLLYSSDFSSGRGYIYSKLSEHFNLFGYGMFGDRVILKGFYAHNVFLEIVIDFGLIAGIVLSIFLMCILCIGIFSCEYKFYKYIKICIPTGLIMLLVSSSYLLQVPSFYILLGLCRNCIVEGKFKLR